MRGGGKVRWVGCGGTGCETCLAGMWWRDWVRLGGGGGCQTLPGPTSWEPFISYHEGGGGPAGVAPNRSSIPKP